MYKVIDTKTGQEIGAYKSASTARKIRDKKDSEYGACRYIVKAPWSDNAEHQSDQPMFCNAHQFDNCELD